MMDAGQEITVADLRAALQKQNMQEADVKEGDAVFFNTGWGKLWMKNNDKFNSGEPGIGMEVAKWCIDKGICLTGADNWATEVVPNPNKNLAFPVHAELHHQERHLQPREPGLHGADRRPQVSVRLHLLAGADQRRDGLERRPDGDDLTGIAQRMKERPRPQAGALMLRSELVAFDDPAAHERMIRIVARPSTAEALSRFDGAKNSSDIDDCSQAPSLAPPCGPRR